MGKRQRCRHCLHWERCHWAMNESTGDELTCNWSPSRWLGIAKRDGKDANDMLKENAALRKELIKKAAEVEAIDGYRKKQLDEKDAEIERLTSIDKTHICKNAEKCGYPACSHKEAHNASAMCFVPCINREGIPGSVCEPVPVCPFGRSDEVEALRKELAEAEDDRKGMSALRQVCVTFGYVSLDEQSNSAEDIALWADGHIEDLLKQLAEKRNAVKAGAEIIESVSDERDRLRAEIAEKDAEIERLKHANQIIELQDSQERLLRVNGQVCDERDALRKQVDKLLQYEVLLSRGNGDAWLDGVLGERESLRKRLVAEQGFKEQNAVQREVFRKWLAECEAKVERLKKRCRGAEHGCNDIEMQMGNEVKENADLRKRLEECEANLSSAQEYNTVVGQRRENIEMYTWEWHYWRMRDVVDCLQKRAEDAERELRRLKGE